ncbi:MAG: sigma-70 family RNA polymerase sigma factor [Planctomycetota bacterium]
MTTHDELLKHAGFVRGLARKLAGDAHEDVAQEALLAAIEHGPRHSQNVRGWLARVVRNKALMARRTDGRRSARERSTRPPAAALPVDEAVGRLELHELLVRETLALHEPYRTALILRYFDGLSPQQIGLRLGVPRRTVATRLHRALAQLRTRLDSRCGCRTAWAPALLVLARPSDMAWKGAIVMASKLAFAAGGFLLGAAATFTISETLRSGPAPRAGSPRATARVEVPIEPVPENPGSQPVVPAQRDAEHYLRRINEATADKQLALIAKEMLALPAKKSRALLFEIYDRIGPPARRVVMARFFALHLGYPYITDMLHRCARDGSFDIRQWAMRTLKDYALIDFTEHPDDYDAWRARAAGRTRDQVLLDSARDFAERLRTLSAAAMRKELRSFYRPRFSPKASGETGLLEVFRDIVDQPIPVEEHGRSGPTSDAQQAAWNWITVLRPDESFLKETVLPHARRHGEQGTGNNAANAIRILAASKHAWVFDELIPLLRAPGNKFGLGNAFSSYGDKRAIPHLIAAIAADPQYQTVYGLGYFGLGKLTGVKYDESHDGKWWLAWWDKNRDRLPADVRALDPRQLR